MLDIESFTYLNRALESSISPLVILASNRGLTTIRGTDDQTAAHGLPPDLLARLLIVPTHPYTPAEITTIVRLRAKTEGILIADPALEQVAELGVGVSLRYALQLLTPAGVLARVAGKKEIGVEEVKECEALFVDARRSAGLMGGGGNGNGGAAGYIVA